MNHRRFKEIRKIFLWLVLKFVLVETEVRNSGIACAQTPPHLKKTRGELLSAIFLGAGVVCKQATLGNYRKKKNDSTKISAT